MKAYYEEKGITIYHADSREVLPSLPKVDLVLTDPPYGVGMHAFDDDFETVNSLNECGGLIAAVFTSPRRVSELLTILSKSWSFNRTLTMHKTADIAFPWRGWCMNSESIVIASREGAEWPKQDTYRSDVYTVGPWQRTGKHPNEKPLDVILDLAQRLSTGAGTLLDPFMGSGTTLRAAKDLGRKAIGIEIEEKYCEIAANRLRQEVLSFEAVA